MCQLINKFLKCRKFPSNGNPVLFIDDDIKFFFKYSARRSMKVFLSPLAVENFSLLIVNRAPYH